jgi:hypothetical protein
MVTMTMAMIVCPRCEKAEKRGRERISSPQIEGHETAQDECSDLWERLTEAGELDEALLQHLWAEGWGVVGRSPSLPLSLSF